jgi:hypothetical protein
MKQVLAEINHDRWIIFCPTCAAQGVLSALEVIPGKLVVCPEEYPNILARAFVPHPRIKGAFTSIDDAQTRDEAYQQAVADGNAFKVVYPDEKVKIESALRERPRSARNWWQGVSAAELVEENKKRRTVDVLPIDEPTALDATIQQEVIE